MKNISIDLIISISEYLDLISIFNLSLLNTRFNQIKNNFMIQYKKRSAIIILKFFLKIKNNYFDLRLNRKGYLINYKKLYKYPNKYINKKIQFKSIFQYYPNNLRSGEIGEGKLEYHENTDSWYFNLDNSFYNYLEDEPLPTNHLLFPAFIDNYSFRVIKDN